MLPDWWKQIVETLTHPLLPIGEKGVSLGLLLKFVVLSSVLFLIIGRIRAWVTGRVLTRTSLDASARQAIGSVIHYLGLVIGFLLILQNVGLDLTALSVVVGGLGFGLGFGLQNIATNLVSGFIVLLERPVKIGDRVEVAGTEGQVVEIRARSTTVLTNDNIAILIPNSRFITEEVVNWSYSDSKVRFAVPVGVSYSSDARKVERLLLSVARENPDVLPDPQPAVQFAEFGDSSLNFVLLVWTATLVHQKRKLVSDLNFAIFEKFAEHNIEIPFPQRDLHLRSGWTPPVSGSDLPPDSLAR